MYFVQTDDIVTIHYTLTYMDGSIFDSTRLKDPLTFVVGDAIFIPGIEKHVIGMAINQIKKVILSPEEAFGPRLDDLIKTIPRKEVPSHINCVVGQRVELSQEDGKKLEFTIIEVNSDTISIDANPPQAGKEMRLSIEVISIS